MYACMSIYMSSVVLCNSIIMYVCPYTHYRATIVNNHALWHTNIHSRHLTVQRQYSHMHVCLCICALLSISILIYACVLMYICLTVELNTHICMCANVYVSDCGIQYSYMHRSQCTCILDVTVQLRCPFRRFLPLFSCFRARAGTTQVSPKPVNPFKLCG